MHAGSTKEPDPPPPVPPPVPPKDYMIPVIVLSIIGGVALLLTILIILLYLRRRRAKRQTSAQWQEKYLEQNDNSTRGPNPYAYDSLRSEARRPSDLASSGVDYNPWLRPSVRHASQGSALSQRVHEGACELVPIGPAKLILLTQSCLRFPNRLGRLKNHLSHPSWHQLRLHSLLLQASYLGRPGARTLVWLSPLLLPQKTDLLIHASLPLRQPHMRTHSIHLLYLCNIGNLSHRSRKCLSLMTHSPSTTDARPNHLRPCERHSPILPERTAPILLPAMHPVRCKSRVRHTSYLRHDPCRMRQL